MLMNRKFMPNFLVIFTQLAKLAMTIAKQYLYSFCVLNAQAKLHEIYVVKHSPL